MPSATAPGVAPTIQRAPEEAAPASPGSTIGGEGADPARVPPEGAFPAARDGFPAEAAVPAAPERFPAETAMPAAATPPQGAASAMTVAVTRIRRRRIVPLTVGASNAQERSGVPMRTARSSAGAGR
jgi:hypothetical protein